MADEPTKQKATPDGESQATSYTYEEEERYRGATPPGYDWPTHGGYLGCLLGVMTGCLLVPLGYIVVGFVGALLAQPLGGFGVALAIIVTTVGYLAIFVGLSRLGWALGKRFLREYEQPSRPVWGEDDEEDYPLVVEADPGSGASAEMGADTDADASASAETKPDAEPTQPQSESAS